MESYALHSGTKVDAVTRHRQRSQLQKVMAAKHGGIYLFLPLNIYG